MEDIDRVNILIKFFGFWTPENQEKLNDYKMKNGMLVKDSLVALIAKIGEKITIRRTNFFFFTQGAEI